MKSLRIAATTVLLAVSGAATAQSILWSHRIFGAPNPDSPTQFLAYAPGTGISTTRPLMAWSATGTPGIATVGRHTYDGLVAKLSAIDGSELWRRELDESIATSLLDIAVDGSGNLVVGGGRTVSGLVERWYVAKIAGSDGQRLWQQEITVPTSPGGGIVRLATTAGDDIVAVGSRSAETNPQTFVMKLSAATGAPLWTTAIPYYTTSSRAVLALDAAGNSFVSPTNAIVVKLTPEGSVSWTVNLATEPGLAACAIRALEVDPVTTDVIVAGSGACQAGQKAYAARIRNADGDVVWSVADLGGAAVSDVSALAFPGGGAVFVAGGRGVPAQPQQWFAARLSLADGAAAWTASVSNQTLYAATDLAVGPSGEMLLSGVCAGNAYCAARLDGATGTRDWITQTGTPYAANDENYPNAILAGGGGVFFGGKDTSENATTWTVHRIDNALADAIFANDFE